MIPTTLTLKNRLFLLLQPGRQDMPDEAPFLMKKRGYDLCTREEEVRKRKMVRSEKSSLPDSAPAQRTFAGFPHDRLG
jgi:hypothetical protein